MPQPDANDDAVTRQLARDFDPGRLPAGFYEDPYPVYRALQRFDPLHACPDGSLFVTRAGDLDTVYRDRTHFSSDKRVAFAPRFGTDSPLFEHHTTSLVFNDPPYHTRVRRHIVSALSPATLKAMSRDLEILIERLCDAMQTRGDVDLIEDFAAAIPVEVIGNLLGVPAQERGALRGWSVAILAALDPAPTPAALARGNASVTEFLEFTRALLADRRRRPRGAEDLLSRLILEESAQEPLTATELQHNCIFLLNAGHETTTNLIGNGLQLLLSHPAERERLSAEPGFIGSAVEECLRFESPNQLGNRLVVQDMTLGDRHLTTGTYLTLCIGAANRDPDAFEDPDRFDITRQSNRHVAFAAGAHACAGMNVARLEGQLAIAAFLRRFPRAELTGGARRSPRARFRGFESLPARID